MFVELKIDDVFKIKKEVLNTTNVGLTNENATESQNDCVQQEIQMEEEQDNNAKEMLETKKSIFFAKTVDEEPGKNELTEIKNSEGKHVKTRLIDFSFHHVLVISLRSKNLIGYISEFFWLKQLMVGLTTYCLTFSNYPIMDSKETDLLDLHYVLNHCN